MTITNCKSEPLPRTTRDIEKDGEVEIARVCDDCATSSSNVATHAWVRYVYKEK